MVQIWLVQPSALVLHGYWMICAVSGSDPVTSAQSPLLRFTSCTTLPGCATPDVGLSCQSWLRPPLGGSSCNGTPGSVAPKGRPIAVPNCTEVITTLGRFENSTAPLAWTQT